MADNPAPLILLTRPRAQSERFAREVTGLAETRIIPLQEIVPTGAIPQLDAFRGLIFTSENAVRVFADASESRHLTAWCVGDRTAEAAEAAGMPVEIAGGNADALVDLIRAKRPIGPLLHLRGRHSRGEVARRLSQTGVSTEAAEIYEQRACQPSEPLSLLSQDRPVLAPLFSPRSAELLAAQIRDIDGQWHFPCLSEAVRQALPDALRPNASVAMKATSKAMLRLLKDHISP